MTSLVHRTAMFLLLIVCRSALHQVSAASSCPLLDIVTLLSGHFYLVDGGTRIDVTSIPVDNPTLNQYKPFYYKETWNDTVFVEGISLFAEGSGISYTNYFYFFNNHSQYETPESHLSEITRDDLEAYPACTENGILNGDTMNSTIYCYMYGVHGVNYSERTCSYWRLVKTVLGYPESAPLPVYNYRIKEYPLPASWLEGHEDYVSL